MSLRLQTALALAIAILAVSLGIGYAVTRITSDRLEQDIGGSLAELAFIMGDKLDRDMAARSAEVYTLTVVDELRHPDEPSLSREMLDALQNAVPAFSWLGVLSSDGTVVAASGGILEGRNIAQRPVFSEGIKGKFVGDVHEAVLLANLLPNPTGEAMKFVDIAYPIFNPAGETVGVLATHLSWGWAREIQKALLTRSKNRKNVDIFIVARDDLVLLADSDEKIGQTLSLDAVAKARSEGPGWTVETWPDGQDYVTGYAVAEGYGDFDGFGWTVVTRQPVTEAFAPIKDMSRRIEAWGIGLAVLVAATGWIAVGVLTRPLAQIAASADRIRKGEEIDIPIFHRPMEIAALSDGLNKLIHGLRKTESALDQMEMHAHHDRLTGLPNRLSLDVFFETAVPRARRDESSIALLYIDLDDFKPVNDTMGHAMGDFVLQEVGVRLSGMCRGGEVAARLGGDEFVMVAFVSKEEGQVEAENIAARIVEGVAKPYMRDGQTAHIGCSVGGAFLPGDAETVSDLFARADEALYIAKEAGKNRYAFVSDAGPAGPEGTRKQGASGGSGSSS
ncbi:diguanylate cyclase [Rhodospirillaceae bacterium KN72]|uniref:Diguanylate cyclase n=1 Tax=Pacificispira spongiicola TaxID=2729598 RepID=A0A7Y0E0C9_9PROT|nr:sensor domain-containing diguanylate cyclase [Pacificispira spongiicola]NMM44793.1 diguanylate cyclase [Pacificispira spongiicola]